MTSSIDAENFLKWFQKSGATVDYDSIGITDFPPSDGGRGAIALKDLPVTCSLARYMHFITECYSWLGRSSTFYHSALLDAIDAHIPVARVGWLRKMETTWTEPRLGWANPLHDVGGFPRKRFEVV